MQAMYEEAFFALANRLHEKSGNKRLCLAGGCGYNSVANGLVFERTPFRELYIQAAAGDAGGAAQQRAQPCQQFFGMERLGQIIIGPGIKACHLVAPAIARGQDQDWHHLAGLAPILQYRDAIHLGQAEIQDHRVIRFGVTQEMTFLAIFGAVDHIAGISQRLLQKR